MDVYQRLRNLVMTQEPASVGIAPQAPLDSVWGALVEIGLSGGYATFVSLADGTTSMYTSSGGGVIGAGAHEGPAEASRQLLIGLQAHLDLFPRAKECPLPGPDGVAFVVLAFDGIRRTESTTTRLADPTEPLHGMWIAANKVITEVRLQGSAAETENPAGGVSNTSEPEEKRGGLGKLFRRGH